MTGELKSNTGQSVIVGEGNDTMPPIPTKGAIDENGNRVPVDIELPKWDQKAYWGRAKHFFTVTNPANLFVTAKQLEEAKDTVTRYRKVGEKVKNI